jgi:hypothetical protein
MSDDAKQPEPKVAVQKGYQPVTVNSQPSDLSFEIRHGYQPDKGSLDVSKPPKGGSGVPVKNDPGQSGDRTDSK